MSEASPSSASFPPPSSTSFPPPSPASFPPPSPKAAGRNPTIRRFDDPDLPWQAVRAQRNADGSESYVKEKRFAFSAEPHIELPLGAAFGPLVAGDDGCVLFEVMMGDPRSSSDEPEAYARVPAERGVEPLPDPPLEYPPWLQGLRTHWGATAE